MDTKSLRQKILDLAIRGKLVPQDPNDEPASVLLERIRIEKQQMVKDGKLKAKDINGDSVIFKGEDNLHYEKMSDGMVKCIEDEIPFEVPESWTWCRLNDVIQLFSGQDFPPDKYNDKGDGIPYITGASNMDNGAVIINRWTQYPQVHACAGDLLLTCKGAGVGKMAFLHEADVHIARQIMALRPNKMLHKMYMKTVVSARIESVISQANGLIPGIKREVILGFLFPLPPIDEQQRISEAVSLAFEQIETIEFEKCDLALIIAQAKSKILDLAIRGKLVPQNPDDEPASVLFGRIRAEKEELIKAGKIKRDKNESYIFRGDDKSYYERIDKNETKIDDLLPFSLPSSWEWCKLSSVWTLLSGRDLTPSEYNDVSNGIPYITGASNFENGQLTINRWTSTPKVISSLGDLLITCKGTVGEMLINEIGDVHIARQIMAFRTDYTLNMSFFQYTLMFYIRSIQYAAHGVIPGIAREDLLNIYLPLPPFPEQQRIVTAIDAAFAQLDTIADALT